MKTLLQIITILSIFVSCSKEGSNPVSGNNTKNDPVENKILKSRIYNGYNIKTKLTYLMDSLDLNNIDTFTIKENYDSNNIFYSFSLFYQSDSSWKEYDTVPSYMRPLITYSYIPNAHLIKAKSKNCIISDTLIFHMVADTTTYSINISNYYYEDSLKISFTFNHTYIIKNDTSSWGLDKTINNYKRDNHNNITTIYKNYYSINKKKNKIDTSYYYSNPDTILITNEYY